MEHEISVSRSVLVKLRDFENTNFVVTRRGTPDAITDEETLTLELIEKVERALLMQVERHFRVRGKKVTRAEICKMYGLTDGGD